MRQQTLIPDVVDRGSLRAVVKDAYLVHYGDIPVDRFLVRPRDEIAFCDRIKGILGAPELKDEDILQTLVNLRKVGEIKTRKEDRSNPASPPRV